jgi:hypothetical protein
MAIVANVDQDGWLGEVPKGTLQNRMFVTWHCIMVGVAQLVEPRVVIPVVVGSSPITHPIFTVGGKAMSSGFIEAIRQNETTRVAAYLLAGVDPNFTEDDDLITPLHHASQFDNSEVIEMLIIAGADIFAVTPYENLTPIEVACVNNNWTVAAMLAHHQQYLYLICMYASYVIWNDTPHDAH